MPELPRKKAGIIACSGEEIAEGTVTRLAALKVLHETRHGDTVTLCLPLFLAGGEGERAFARSFPTITVDGCELRCAARATERHSAKPVASIVVTELAAAGGITGIDGRRHLNDAGRRAVDATAEVIAGFVDRVLSNKGPTQEEMPASVETGAPVTCSCGSHVRRSYLEIYGEQMEVVALPALMEQLHREGRPADEASAKDLLDKVRIYNRVPSAREVSWLAAVHHEYARYCLAKKAES